MVKNLDGRSQYIIHIYNSFTFIGRVAFDNKYKILTLNCGSLSIVFAKASEVIMVHGYIYICIYKKGTVFRQTYPPFNPGRWDLDSLDPGRWKML